MEDFEEQALSSAPTTPKIYIDDAFTIWKRNDVEDFLHTASHHSTTNHPFSMETENGNTIPFLDTLVIKDSEVFIKNLHTDQHLSYDTPHSISLRSIKKQRSDLNKLGYMVIFLS